MIKAETELKGGRVNYYLVHVKHPQREDQEPYRAECEDIIRALGMDFDEGTAFKELWRTAAARQGNGKPGHTPLYGAQKVLHYATAIHRAAVQKEEDKPRLVQSQNDFGHSPHGPYSRKREAE